MVDKAAQCAYLLINKTENNNQPGDEMRDGDIITAKQLEEIIEKNGGGQIMFGGNFPENYTNAAELGLEASDTFTARINYAHPVQFCHGEAVITTGLCGRCEYGDDWQA